MARKPFGKTNLIIPPEALLGIASELNIVGWIGVHEVVDRQGHSLEVTVGKVPIPQQRHVIQKVGRVRDPLVPPEGDVELALPIEAAEAVIAGTVQVVEEFRGLSGVMCSTSYDRIKPFPVLIVDHGIVCDRHCYLEAASQPRVEVYGVLVDVVKECRFGHQAKGYGKSAAEGFDEAALLERLPQGFEVRDKPSLATCPFQRGLQLSPRSFYKDALNGSRRWSGQSTG